MKTNRLIAIIALGALLCATPVYAQRGGGSRSGGSHSSSSSSRSGSSHSSSSSSRSSSSHSSSSSRSSMGSSSSRSGSSSYNSGSSRHSGTVSRSSSNSSSRSSSSVSSSRSSQNSSPSRNQSASRGSSRHSSVGAPISSSPSGRNDRSMNRDTRNTNRIEGTGSHSRNSSGRGGSQVNGDRGGNHSPNRGGVTAGRNQVHSQPRGHGYARPGHPGHMPPSHRPMHPAPYFHHPYHHGIIHMRPIVWVHVHPRPLYWPGFWVYCNSYWYDYHVTDVTVVHHYVKETYNVDMVSYAISGDLMYAIVNDSDGRTYMQVYDNNDKLLAEQEISSRYIKTEIDRENGGCWIFKKRDKDPMLFLYVDGELLIYEAD